MHLSPASRPARVRRVLAISAAAVAVMIGPTACNYDVATLHGGGGTGVGTDEGSDPTVVPVVNSKKHRYHGRDHGSGAPTTTAAAAPTTDPTVEPVSTTTSADPSATVDPSVDPTLAPTTAPVAAAGKPGDVGPALPPGGKFDPTDPTKVNNGLDILGRDCSTSKLPLHDGFQDDPAGSGSCVNTEMGEVAAKSQLPSLLITDAPRVVGMNQAFTLKVATRNLNRNRFLGAAKGGYYIESSFLDKNGIQQGHFHTACRILPTTDQAPDSSVDPQFFVATEDDKSDTAAVTIPVPAIKTAGILQCTSWAGDGSHRTPMMTLAKETPAIDSVRIVVTPQDQPVQYDVAAANAATANTDNAHAAQAGPQAPDANAPAPAAPNAGSAPATASAPAAVDNAAAPAVVKGVAAAPASSAPVSKAPVSDATSSSAPTSSEKKPAGDN